MPSPDAILGDASFPEMDSTYDGLGADMEDFGTSTRMSKIPNFGRMMMGRQLTSSIAMMSLLGFEADRNSAIMRFLRIMLVSNMAIFGFYRMITAARRAVTSQHMGLAAAETVANMNPAMFWKIPIAIGAAALVGTTFAVGEKFGSGDWNLPSVNVSSPSDRRSAERHMRGVRASGR